MIKRPKVSVVVPIYGVEKYLHQCVNSILAQTLDDIEIILVDDGSKDKCPQIVDEFALKDKRVVAVHQPNGGYGRAVNHGIELATGEYVGIVESDDWIEPDMYEKLYASAKRFDTDTTKCGFYRYNSLLPYDQQNTRWLADFQDIMDAPDEAFDIKQYPQMLIFHASVWASIYKSDFVKSLKFIESKSASYQDFPFMIEVMCKAQRMSVVKDYLIHYRMEEGQDSSTIRRDERLIMMAKQCIEGKKILKEYGLYDELKEEFYYHSFLANMGFYKNIYFKYKRPYFKVLQDLFEELKADKSFTYKYFKKSQKRTIKKFVEGRYLASLVSLKAIRRFLINFRLSRSFVTITLLGVALVIKFRNVPVVIRNSLLNIVIERK